ncbi:MAG: type II toxin-antitoxin system RelE/ParE family toxin [Desulfotomaculaceae bacterium]|nr:type II toxin-antitoxin system RelE/ParE family toxin [Desulfotomaculaceae bacterium]
MDVLYDDMEAGEVLVGDLADHYKIDFAHKSVEYRIVYNVMGEEEILVVYCGTRENAYVKIKRSL